MADALALPANAIIATDKRVWIKRVILVGHPFEEQFWLEASGNGVARLGNGGIQKLLDSGEAEVLRPLDTVPHTPEVGRG